MTSNQEFRRLAKLAHPDTPTGSEEAFKKLTEHRKPHPERWTVNTTKRAYSVSVTPTPGTLANIYPAVHENGHAILKIPRRPTDSDLMQAETVNLQAIRTVKPTHNSYLPTPVESFRYREATTKKERRVNVFEQLDGFHTLAEIAQAYPAGVNPRDLAWMWRRMLVGVGLAHQAGYVHGALTPDNVYIQPEVHGLVLLDWCYSVPTGSKLKAITDYHHHYPKEVFDKNPVTAATDIFIATKSLLHIAGTLPTPLRGLARACTLDRQRSRPQDAWQLLEDLDEILERTYGPRKFHPFKMPQRKDNSGIW